MTTRSEASMRYEFAVSGGLSELAVSAFPGFRRAAAPVGTTRLVGEVADEDDLYELLARLGDLGLDLVHLRRLPE